MKSDTWKELSRSLYVLCYGEGEPAPYVDIKAHENTMICGVMTTDPTDFYSVPRALELRNGCMQNDIFKIIFKDNNTKYNHGSNILAPN